VTFLDNINKIYVVKVIGWGNFLIVSALIFVLAVTHSIGKINTHFVSKLRAKHDSIIHFSEK